MPYVYVWVYIYIYVCMYIYVYIFTYANTLTVDRHFSESSECKLTFEHFFNSYVWILTNTHIHNIYIYIYIYIHIYIYMIHVYESTYQSEWGIGCHWVSQSVQSRVYVT